VIIFTIRLKPRPGKFMVMTEVRLESEPLGQGRDQWSTWPGRVKTAAYPQQGQGREILHQLPKKGLPALAEASPRYCMDVLPHCHHFAIGVCERKQSSWCCSKR